MKCIPPLLSTLAINFIPIFRIYHLINDPIISVNYGSANEFLEIRTIVLSSTELSRIISQSFIKMSIIFLSGCRPYKSFRVFVLHSIEKFVAKVCQ